MATERYSGRTYIGSGGMASVFKAWDETLHRPVAIKELTEDLRANEEVRKLFLSEARKMASVRHPNIVQVFDVSDDSSVPTIIMEYLEGGSLAAQMGSGPLTVDEVLAVIRQVASGLKAIHAAGLVHRDVKPENIIEDGGTYKIADFGVAMSGDEDALPFVTNKYAAPEVLLAPEEIGPASDVYSLGVMAIEMLLGPRRFEEIVHEAIEADPRLQLPAIKDSTQAFWQQWVASDVELPSLDTLVPTVSAPVAGLLGDMTRRNREDRISDCGALLKRLDEMVKGSEKRATAPTEYSPKMKKQLERSKAKKDSPGAGKKKKPLWFKLTLVTVLLLVLAIGVLFLLPSGPPRYYFDIVTNPPGASLTLNDEVVDGVTPARIIGTWGDKVLLQLEGHEALEITLAENMPGITAAEESYRLEVAMPGSGEADFIATSAEAAEALRAGLPQAWTFDVSLAGVATDGMDDARSIPVGTDINFNVNSSESASIAMIHLGSDDVITVIYPSPFGFAPRVDAASEAPLGGEIGLVAREPLGREWFAFVAAETLQIPPEMPDAQAVGNWATAYPLGEAGSPGERLVTWMIDTYRELPASGKVMQLEIVAGDSEQ